MTKNLKTLILVFLISLPFWWGVNVFQKNLEDFWYQREIANNPHFLASVAHQAELEAKLEEARPIRNKQVDDLDVEAESAIAIFINKKGEERVLFEKNIDEKLPIASITKLMTARIVLEHYTFSEKTENLLALALIESNNEAALNLARIIGEEAFVDLMNLEAQYLGLKNTRFINASGLDGKDDFNYSTAEDLAKFAKHLTAKNPLIWEISIVPGFENATNTNRLLNETAGIIGGKTGETPKAGRCLLLVAKAPENKGYIINVVLNSENRFEEMKKMINWSKYAYKW